MVERPEVLAIIPARGGSKGIPRKNIRDFAGSPLIAYSIAAGLESSLVNRTIVSTDDEEIATTARQFGAEIPFIRPPELAEDHTPDLPVFQHALAWLLENENYHPDFIVQLRPTSPIRPRTCVDDAIKLLAERPDGDSVRGVVPSGQNPHKMWRIDDRNGKMTPLLEVEGIAEPYNAPRQILPKVYWQTGHIDVVRTDVIQKKDSMSGEVILPLQIDPSFTVDIDNLGDWARAEWLVRRGHLDMVLPANRKRTLPDKVELVVFDFDGVITDNRVWVDQNGRETIAAYRSDGIGLSLLRGAGVKMLVLSTEVNPVVTTRCEKLKLPVLQGVDDKASVLKEHLAENSIDPEGVIYLGNDVNDVPCFPVVGCAVVVADAQPQAIEAADIVLSRNGGYGAVRELCEMILDVYFR